MPAADTVLSNLEHGVSQAIAAEREFGLDDDVLTTDVEEEAKTACERRRPDEFEYQSMLEAFAGGETA